MDDRYGFEHPEIWPLRPVLPVKNHKNKRPGEFPDLAIVYEDLFPNKDGKYIVIHAMLGEVLPEDVKRTEFDSIDDLMAAGWVGD